MIKINADVYKYGTYKGSEVFSFESEEELSSWFLDGEEYSNHIAKESEIYEEDLSKWSIRFNYMGKDHQHQIDL